MKKADELFYMPVIVALHKVSRTCESCTAEMNTIMQFAESYLVKADHIKSRLRMSELIDIADIAERLKQKAGLSSEDVAAVITTWIETHTTAYTHQLGLASRLTEMLMGSVRILFANTSVLDAIKAATSPSKDGTN